MERSIYHPLEQSERQFRLLRLLELNSNGTRCEMKSFSLLNDDLPLWKALSYRWGEDEPEFMIYINDNPVLVRKGLQKFITQMIAEERRDWYFIDALCIDQENDLEKTCQVQQMGEIYRRAEEVVTWILYEPYHYEKDEVHGCQAVYDPDDNSHDISSLSRAQVESAVLENSYWSRLWILQEVLLAKRLTIRIGSAEVEWLRLIPDETILEERGLPGHNAIISSIRQISTEPRDNKTAAENILTYRRFKSESLRAGNRLPFHKAVDFFSMQRCGRPHDVVFGYLGLTNSRIQIDYSIPILDLFAATLADWLLSAGYIKESSTDWRGLRMDSGIARDSIMLRPLLAFGLTPNEPVVQLLVREVTKFFAPGFEESITTNITILWVWLTHLEEAMDGRQVYPPDIDSTNVRNLTITLNETSLDPAMLKELAMQQKALEEEDAVMSAPGDSNFSRTYSQWAAHARAISEQIWQRFMESGEDAEGDMDDESWTLIA